MHAGKRVIINTAFLYGKMLISITVAFVSTRLVLQALGVEDYGIFALVGGVIMMLSFLNGAMGTSTQRYISIYLGANNPQKLAEVFRASVRMHLVVGLVIVTLLEITGIFLFDGFLNIAAERLGAAKTVFQFMVVSTFFAVNAVPYDASINAHENLRFDALTGIIESIIKLGIAIWLLNLESDRLIMYSLLMASMTILMRIVKSLYCRYNYAECRDVAKGNIGMSLLKEMYIFTGWNLFGSVARLSRGQGISIVLNLFFGTVMNAAYGIANQVSNQLNTFSVMMLKAINPQIVKSEGANDRNRMLRLSMIASKFSFFLLAFFAIPILFEIPTILQIWLKYVPEYTNTFTRLIIISVMINQLTVGLGFAFQSVGKIKTYQSVVGSILILNIPIAYFLLKYGFSPEYVLYSYIAIELLASILRIVLLRLKAGLNIAIYLKRVIVPSALPVITSMLICYFIVTNFLMPWRFLLTALFSGLAFIISIILFGLMEDEKDILYSILPVNLAIRLRSIGKIAS
jgi:Na+-driven multidrug efflux pump